MTEKDANAPDSLIRSQDFIASPGFMAAPIGGYNEFVQDPTIVLNAPRANDGQQMRFRWIPPHLFDSTYSVQGFLCVPAKYFKTAPPGGTEPLRATSPTLQVDPGGDGKVYRDGKQLLLVWTTQKNHDRCEKNTAEAANRMRGGEVFRPRSKAEQQALELASGGRMSFREEEQWDKGWTDVPPPKITGKTTISMAGQKT